MDKYTLANKFVPHEMYKKHIIREKFQNMASIINTAPTNNLNVFLSKLNIPTMKELMDSLKSENNLEKLSNIPQELLKKKEDILKLLQQKDASINNFNTLLSKIDDMLTNQKDKLNYIKLSEEDKKKFMDIYEQTIDRINDGIKNAQDKENIFNEMLNQRININESDYKKNIDNLHSAERLAIDITDEGILKLENEEKKLLLTSNMTNAYDTSKTATSNTEPDQQKYIFMISIVLILLILLYYYYYSDHKDFLHKV